MKSRHVINRDTRRKLKDTLIRYMITAGGITVLLALLLIFFYLLYVITPLFESAKVSTNSTISTSFSLPSVAIATDEYGEIGYRFDSRGKFETLSLLDKDELNQKSTSEAMSLNLIDHNVHQATSFSQSLPSSNWYGYGLSDGQVALFRPKFITPISTGEGNRAQSQIELTRGVSQPIEQLDPAGSAIIKLSVAVNEQQAVIVGQTADHRIVGLTLNSVISEENGDTSWQRVPMKLTLTPNEVTDLVVTPNGRFVYLLSDTELYVIEVTIQGFHVREIVDVSNGKAEHYGIKLELLAGANSLMITHQDNTISQWFDVISGGERRLKLIRTVSVGDNVQAVVPEYYRKGFFTYDDKGVIEAFFTTSESRLFRQQLVEQPPQIVAISPRADKLIIETEKHWHIFDVDNQHPEISFSSLWRKVWYEGYPEAKYVWQSTAATDDFEPKLSLVPIVFGTLKAAIYAMIFSVPIAVAAAIYTAYFMSAPMRKYVKPSIEIMEALPTVILGFLAGLWLAPIVDTHLPAVLSILLLMPFSVVLLGFIWHCLPNALIYRVPSGWHALLLIPMIVLIVYLSFLFSDDIELWLFNGNARLFLADHGIGFDQRNALVVGLAMGFAVIPTIFSIAEDAIFSVPKHLSDGSFALGATAWQTLTKVVLLTASPGIFSAIMMGLGRAVGETMIVLMATGNTPLLDWNILEGLRTLSANIAIEMPESEVGSSHYRVLFLAAFILFVFTFIFNTLAELVRQRLRDKYRTL